jgi:tetratricopeptide (TPR) repeat protein
VRFDPPWGKSIRLLALESTLGMEAATETKHGSHETQGRLAILRPRSVERGIRIDIMRAPTNAEHMSRRAKSGGVNATVSGARSSGSAARGASPAGNEGEFSTGREWLRGFALLAITVLVFERVRHAGFIWDDEMHVTQNPVVVGPMGLKEIWTSRAARYFPLTLTSFWAEYRLWRLNPLPFHLVNAFMHGACAVALWRVLSVLRVRGAWLGAALWAIHPVQAETVAWVTELKNTQSCLFYLLAVLFFVKWLSPSRVEAPHPSRWYYPLTLAFAGMAMASKSSTVVLPLVLCLCAWWKAGNWRWRTFWAVSPVFLLSAASSALSLWTQHLEGANDPEWARSLPVRIAIAGKVIWFYLGKLVWPVHLTFIYPRWTVDGTKIVSYLPFAGAIGLLLVLWQGRGGRLRAAFFAYAYFLVALIPVLGLADQFFFRYSFVGDHFQYLASMGPLVLAASAFTASLTPQFAKHPVLKPVACAAVLSVIGALAARECPKYYDSEALWRSALKENPRAWMAHNNLGTLLMNAGRTEEAAAHFRASLEIQPHNVSAESNLADALFQSGQVGEALAHYHRALVIDPRDVTAQSNLGAALLRLGKIDEAIPHLKLALEASPDFAKARTDLGAAYLQGGRLDDAIGEFNRVLAAHPFNLDATNDLGTALAQQGRLTEARAQFRRAIEISPKSATAQTNLGNVLMQQGNVSEAISNYQGALRLDPSSAVIHNNLAYALLTQGRLDDAISHSRRALELQPDYPEARRNLGVALGEKSREDQAGAFSR